MPKKGYKPREHPPLPRAVKDPHYWLPWQLTTYQGKVYKNPMATSRWAWIQTSPDGKKLEKCLLAVLVRRARESRNRIETIIKEEFGDTGPTVNYVQRVRTAYVEWLNAPKLPQALPLEARSWKHGGYKMVKALGEPYDCPLSRKLYRPEMKRRRGRRSSSTKFGGRSMSRLASEIWIPTEDWVYLYEFADRRRMWFADVIREAIREKIEREKKK